MNLTELRRYQLLFEDNIRDQNNTPLSEKNTPEHALERGIIGEGAEALEALALHGVASEQFRDEIIDVYIFLASLLNHIGMSDQELEQRTARKVRINFLKYNPRNFQDRTLDEGLKHSRSIFQKKDL